MLVDVSNSLVYRKKNPAPEIVLLVDAPESASNPPETDNTAEAKVSFSSDLPPVVHPGEGGNANHRSDPSLKGGIGILDHTENGTEIVVRSNDPVKMVDELDW